jgi:hypothetical protein
VLRRRQLETPTKHLATHQLQLLGLAKRPVILSQHRDKGRNREADGVLTKPYLKSRTPHFSGVSNLNLYKTAITLKQHFRPAQGTLWQRFSPDGRNRVSRLD